MLDASGFRMLCLTLQSSIVIFCFLPGSTVLHLSDVGSDQLDVRAVRAGGGSITLLPQQLVLTTKAEVRSGTVDEAHREATVERFGRSRRV